ncbi:HEAT repeat domain-containing protein [Lusitaniella coriacea LEGE 07157]|uniref:HEAT repeat domain-containing protein n=1 Tax=Lusitaniella coriacea LEGE 07157 TaxID=945747 RepID=A0A8J7DX60_9CYAN|nr:HEAT repeat domain-containing protein [Lusitaniella coriacea]MBE9115766.1 HEAT repeat domain-containing protein [Lusitaniella coriacea LEGE 07157]
MKHPHCIEFKRNPLLDEAIDAIKEEDFSLVNQYLQQLLLREAESSQAEEETDVRELLQIALTVLEKGDFQERWDLAKLLPKLGDRAIAPLIKIVEDEDADIEQKWFAVRILGQFDRAEVILCLAKLLETTKDSELAAIASTALANLGTPAITALVPLLNTPETRLSAAYALGQIRRREVIDPLLTLVGDADAKVRAIAVETLGSFRDARIDTALIAALADLSPLVRKEAVICLGFRVDKAEELALLDRLKPLLYDFNLEVCQQTAIALSKLKTPDAERTLLEVLQSPPTPIPLQLTLIQALAWMETPSSVQALLQSLPLLLPESALELIRVLGRLEPSALKENAAQGLLNWFAAGGETVERREIKQALAHTWGQLKSATTRDALQQLAQDSETSVRLHAIAALKYFER